MPRSPRATITASEAATISARFVDRRVRLDLGDELRRAVPTTSRTSSTSLRLADERHGDELDARRGHHLGELQILGGRRGEAERLRRQVHAGLTWRVHRSRSGARAACSSMSTTVIEIAPSPSCTRLPTDRSCEQRRRTGSGSARRRSGRHRGGARAGFRATQFDPAVGESGRSRIFGPGRSASTATARPASAATARTARSRPRCSSSAPWLRLRRTTSTPARAARRGPRGRRTPARAWPRSSCGGSYLLIYPTVELLLVRHALPIRRELEDGVADPELSDRDIARPLISLSISSSERIDAVYASPLRRRRRRPTRSPRLRASTSRIEPGLAEWDQNARSTSPSRS